MKEIYDAKERMDRAFQRLSLIRVNGDDVELMAEAKGMLRQTWALLGEAERRWKEEKEGEEPT